MFLCCVEEKNQNYFFLFWKDKKHIKNSDITTHPVILEVRNRISVKTWSFYRYLPNAEIWTFHPSESSGDTTLASDQVGETDSLTMATHGINVKRKHKIEYSCNDPNVFRTLQRRMLHLVEGADRAFGSKRRVEPKPVRK